MAEPLTVALLVVGAGLGLLALVWLALRLVGTPAQALQPVAAPALPMETTAETGLVVARQGGRLEWVNERARLFLGLNGETPNLNLLARRVAPADTFLELFAATGSARLSVEPTGQQLEATSLHLPAEPGRPARVVVLLKEASRLLELGGDDARAAETLGVITELNREIASRLDQAEALETILACMGRAYPYDIAEINLWDPQAEVLRPARVAGNREYERLVTRGGGFAYRLEEALTGHVAARREPLIVGDLQTFTLAKPKLHRADLPFRSYAGLPLIAGERLLGTLELISFRENVYRPADLPLLTAIANQAAVALSNAQAFAEQQRRASELASLAEITRAIEATTDPYELYRRLTSDIARLINVEMVGLLLFDEHRRALLPQLPFYGLPDIAVEAYRLGVPHGGPAEALWEAAPYVLSNQVRTEPAVSALGLTELVETAGVRTTLLVPLSRGGRRIGVVQACNRQDGAPFTDQDVRLLTVFASQAAVIIENARLVREAHNRAVQAEGLRDIAASVAEGTDLDSILRAVMQRAGALFAFDVGLVALLDEASGELRPHPASVYGTGAENVVVAEMVIRTSDPQFKYAVTRSRRPFVSGNAQRDRRIIGVYKPALERFGAASVMDVPLVAGDRSIGEVIVMARREHLYSRADLQLLATIATQMASAVDRARLYSATDANLQRRVDQLTALTRVGRELNQTLELERLLRLVREELLRATQADTASIAVLDLNPEAEPGRVALRLGGAAEAPELTPEERAVVESARLERRAGPPASLIAPIITQEATVGVIHLQRAGGVFDETAAETAAALAAQTAIAVANAQRYAEQIRRSEQLRRRADQLSQLLELSRTVRSDQSLEANLEAIAFGLQEAVGFNVVSLHLLDPVTRRTRRAASVGLPVSLSQATAEVQHPWEHIERLMREEFRLSQSYFLPAERAAHLTVGLDTTPMPVEREQPPSPNAWRPDDMLVVPLFGGGREPLGVLSLDDPRDGQRPGRTTIEVVEIFANQATLTIENVRLFQAVERRAQRLLALHRVSERIGALADPEAVLTAACDALVREMKLDLCLIAMQAGEQLLPRAQAGAIRPEIKLEPLLRQDNPLAHTIDQDFPTFATHVKRSDWEASPFVVVLHLASFMCVPIARHGQAAGALLVGSQQASTALDGNDLELFTILASQISARLDSLALESDIKQRAAQLAALTEASRTITATLRIDDVVRAVLTNLPGVVPHDSVTLWLRGPAERGAGEVLRIAAAQGFENNAERLGLTVAVADSVLFAEMARTGGAIRVADTHTDPRFPGGEFQPTRSWLGAPLISKGAILGALVLDKHEADFYTPAAAQMLSAFANQAAVALDNAQLFEENTERSADVAARSQRLGLINRVSAELGGTLDAEAMFATLLREVMAAMQVAQAAVYEVTDAQALVRYHLPVEGAAPALPGLIADRLREALAPVVVDDITNDVLVAPADQAPLAARGVKSLLAMPLVAARTLIAVLVLEETEAARNFTPGEIELVQTLANQAAVAIQNARLFDEVQVRAAELSQRNERMRALNLLSSTLSASLEVDNILHETAEQLQEMFGVDHTSLIMVDEAAQTGVVQAEHPPIGALGLRLTLSTDAVGHQVLARRVVIVSDVATDQRLSDDFRTKLSALGVHALLLAPFITQGRAFGAFALEAFGPRTFTTDEIELCQTIAAQTASALTNAFFARDLEKRVAERTEELKRERDRVETLLQVTTELSTSLELDRVLYRALELVTEAVNATQGSIFTLDSETDQLIYRAALGSPKVLAPGGEPAPFKKHDGLVGWVIRSRQAVVIHNLDTDTRWKKIPGQNVTHRSALAVPLIANEEVLGAMILYSPLYNAFDEEQMRLAAAAANQVGAATNNAELYRILREQAERLGSLLRVQQVETTKNRAILEGIADGVLVTDGEGRIILLNTACERMLGLAGQQTIGRPIGEFIGLFGGAGRMWTEAMTTWSQDPSRLAEGPTNVRVELEDSQRVVAISLAPVTTGDEYLGAVALIRDITREAEVDRLKSEFVTNVSHELRTPITPIKGFADMLLMGAGGPLTPMQSRMVDTIKSNAERLNLLVNDLLDTSRIESGKIQVVLGQLSVREIVNTVIESLQAQMLEKKKVMNLHVEVPESLPAAWGDHMRLTQVLSNVAENAYSYTHDNGTITLRAEHDPLAQEIVLEITDTGVGISPEQQARLFDRFFRGENALVMDTPGTGLGLSIAKQLIEMQGGRIWLKHTAAGQGSTFAIAIPVATPERIKALAAKTP